MNKKLLPILLVFILIGTVKAQVLKQFIIKGEISKNANGHIYLDHIGKGKWTKDSAEVKNGYFILKSSILYPVLGRLTYNKKVREIFLEPANMNLIAKDQDISNASITGSKSQVEYDELKGKLLKIDKRWKTVMDTLNAVNKRSNTKFQELKNWVLNPYLLEIKEETYNFYSKNPNSYATAYSLIIEQRDLSTDSLNLFFNRLSPTVKQSLYGQTIFNAIEGRKKGAVKTIAPNFSRIDINGVQLSLADFKGKYILLDFWGSWCVPCRKGNPHLIELYEKYKNKGIEFIGVASDDKTQDAWKKAILDDKLPWRHVLTGSSKDNIAEIYNVMYYPTKILINKDGVVLGRFGEESTNLDEMLAQIFK